MLEQRIQQQFFDSADLQYQTAESLARPIADAAQALTGCLTSGGKLLVAGLGGSAALAVAEGTSNALGQMWSQTPKSRHSPSAETSTCCESQSTLVSSA